jgi:hypothetical protein
MGRRLLKGVLIALLTAGVVAAYLWLAWTGATVFELVMLTITATLLVAVVALTLHLRELHRALYRQSQVAYQGFMLNFFLSLRDLLRERRSDQAAVESDLVWSLIEDYFRREAELYNTVVEELYDKTSMMHILDRGRIRRAPAVGDARPDEPLYQELHALLGRLREERRAREEGAPHARVAGPGDAA